MANVAQLVRASVCGTGCRGFKSLHSPHLHIKFIFLFMMMIRITIDGHPFEMQMTQTQAESQKGLMFVDKMDDDKGMVFPINPQIEPSFWMKNTLIPLDLLFVDKDHKITHIVKSARPLSLKHLKGPKGTHYVIEVNGGLTDKMNIDIGDKVGGLK